jgi:hypothetical protein
MKVRSEFTLWVLFILLLAIVVFALLFVVGRNYLEKGQAPMGWVILYPIGLSIVFLWLLFVEIRKRAIVVVLKGDEIFVSDWLGFKSSKTYHANEISGFETVNMSSRYRTYEYLFLIKGGVRIACISEYYHSNYADIKAKISETVFNLGERRFSFLKELFKPLQS